MNCRVKSNYALLVIDMQNDFCDGGVLAVPRASSLIPTINAAIRFCKAHGTRCVFTRDWHPPDHQSFVAAGGVWPPHCIQNTQGAEFVGGLQVPKDALVMDKGCVRTSDGYSAFQDTNLADALRLAGIMVLVVCGVATEYCVSATVKDALAGGFAVSVLQDLILPIDKQAGDGAAAVQAMRLLGATITSSEAWMRSID